MSRYRYVETEVSLDEWEDEDLIAELRARRVDTTFMGDELWDETIELAGKVYWHIRDGHIDANHNLRVLIANLTGRIL